MKYIAVVCALAACQSPAAQPDAAPDSGYVSPCHPQAGPLCRDTCGNGVVDDCQVSHLHGEECIDFVWTREKCDGDAIACTSLDYYGGTASCAQCAVNAATCDPCPPDAELCSSFASGAFAAGPGPNTIVRGTFGILDVFDVQGTALASTAQYTIPSFNPVAIAAVPNGWIAVSEVLGVVHVSDTGIVSSATNIPSLNADTISATYAAGRVLIVWKMTDGVHAATVDASNGSLIGGTVDVFSEPSRPSVTTDGTAFFVAIPGHLAKVLGDGTIAASTAFGGNPQLSIQVTCAGTTCWYVAPTSTAYDSFFAQRFDENAASVGAPVTIAPGFALSTFLADGSDLLALQWVVSTARFQILRFNSAGGAIGMKTIATATATSISTDLFHVGSRVGVRFFAPTPYLAITTPP